MSERLSRVADTSGADLAGHVRWCPGVPDAVEPKAGWRHDLVDGA